MIPLVAPSYNDADREAVREAAAHLEQGEQYVARLEARLAEHFGAVGAVCTTSGTAALHLALMAVDIRAVTLPTFSCVALLNATNFWGGWQRLTDCNYDPERMDYNTPDYAKGHIRPDMFGVRSEWPDMACVIEDRAMSLGAEPRAIQGECAVLSFHESKIISGQHGGAVVTNDPDLLARLRDLNGYVDAVVADRLNPMPTYTQRTNYRMSGLNAALALSQLDRLSEFVARRAKIARYYNDVLKECPAILPTKVPEGSVFGRYCLAMTQGHPINAIAALAKYGIEAGRGVWPPLHVYLQTAENHFPNAEKAGRTVLSLPVWPGLTDSEVDHIAVATRDVLSR